jgi:hypothetical protein
MIYTSISKKILLAATIILLCTCAATAQHPFNKSLYRLAIGAKYYALGISARFSSGQAGNLEGQAFKTVNNTRLGMLYEVNRSVKQDLNWYAGCGPHLAVWEQNWKAAHHMYGSDASIGFDGITGLDYKPGGSPVNISIDWQPSFTPMGPANGGCKLELLFGGISLRLAL